MEVIGKADQVLTLIGDGRDLGERFDVHEDVVVNLVEEFQFQSKLALSVIAGLEDDKRKANMREAEL